MKKLLGLLMVVTPLLAVAQSGIDGTWRINLDKLQIDPKPHVFELKDGMYSCSSCDPKISVKADGQDQKVSGSPYADTVSVTQVSANTVQIVDKKNGTVTARMTDTVSADGKTMDEKWEYHPADSPQAVTGTAVYSRLGDPEAGAHEISGSWKREKYESVSGNGLTFTYAMSGEGLNYKASTGESYSAKFDGKDYPYSGDPGTTSVVLKKVDDHTFEETYKRKGEVVGMSRISISPDGKSLTLMSKDMRRGTTDTMVAEKKSGSGDTMADK